MRVFSYDEAFRLLHLTSYDFRLCGYLKSNVYCGGVAYLNDIKYRVTQYVRNITPDAIHSAVQHVMHHIDCVTAEWNLKLVRTAMRKRNHIMCGIFH
ncbi:hypothetical protein NPIL_403111 [Nephila pilipes]|uniref:Uncharacterized protein n=1 Tax=Nephila pilipes TaxID=299642 RepID=A0A8X6UTI0_NEPPI|nr:hypothetical protein NPIL_403111 [Nephila pilipes]